MKPMFSPAEIRKDFPIFSKGMRGGNRLVISTVGLQVRNLAKF